MNRMLFIVTLLVAVSFSALVVGQSQPETQATQPVSDAIRTSKLEVVNTKGKVIFAVSANAHDDGEILVADANGKTRLSILMPHYPSPSIPSQTNPGITLTLFNEGDARTFQVLNKGLTSGGAMMIGGGTETGVGDVTVAATGGNNSSIVLNNGVGRGVVIIHSRGDEAGDGQVGVTNKNGGKGNQLKPKP